MLQEKERLAAEILTILKDAAQPVGCGAISSMLRKKGYSVSEATVGRILRDFDECGYALKAGYQGRLISPTGMEKLQELATKSKGLRWGAELAEALQGHTKEQLLEVLVARRAIESELAALAAVNGTRQQIDALAACLEGQFRGVEKGETTAEADVCFHATIAEMAGNRVLASAIKLIRVDTQLSPVLEFIRKRVHSMVYIDHKNIYEAIAGRAPEKARQAMITHVNNLIADVERYWEGKGG
ncbi:MAG: FCD domain-containing protein [Negativicutes bacterium]|nr:FCD domain-containing protein [Negativicutes bacterium]